MRELLIATKNPGKFREIMEVLEPLSLKFWFLGDLDIDDRDFVEDGESYAENAFKKAKYYGEKTGLTALAEDSGLVVDALRGELGVQTRRWGAGENASDEEWLNYFIERMQQEENRLARFVCSACVVDIYSDHIDAKYFFGETPGVITREAMAPILEGLPLSSVFLPEGQKQVYAALSRSEKNKISHRGKAIRSVYEFLGRTLA